MNQRLYQLSVHHHFDAAHHLPDYKGKCAMLHGHRWEVEVGIAATYSHEDLLERSGMIVDFAKIKGIINQWDHQCLNDFMGDPTAEVIATRIFEQVCNDLDLFESQVQVTVWESPDCSVTIGGYDVSQ